MRGTAYLIILWPNEVHPIKKWILMTLQMRRTGYLLQDIRNLCNKRQENYLAKYQLIEIQRNSGALRNHHFRKRLADKYAKSKEYHYQW